MTKGGYKVRISVYTLLQPVYYRLRVMQGFAVQLMPRLVTSHAGRLRHE